MKTRVLVFGMLSVLLLAACGSDNASRNVEQGAQLLNVTFDAADDWETGTFPADDPTASLAIQDGRYRVTHSAERSASFTWGQDGEAFEDVIIEVTAEQISEYDNNLYGVACRLAEDERGNQTGYALLISGDGHYGIADLSHNSLDFLLEWHQTREIHEGQETNTIRAVCAADYLALYVNGEFLGEVEDDAYRRAGQVGLVAGVNKGESVEIAFDDLAVYAATID